VHIEPTFLEIDLVEGSSLPVSVGSEAEIQLEAGWKSRWELSKGAWKEVARERR
jgi:hypothetical protein